MKTYLFALLFTLAPLPCLAAVTIESNVESIGDAFQYGSFKKTFNVANDGAEVVRIEGIDPASRFGQVVDFPRSLGPGEKAAIVVEAQTLDSSGIFICGFIARLSDGSTVPFTVRGFVMSAYDELNPRIDFGEIKASDAEAKTLVLHTHEQATLKILKVLERPGFVDVAVDGDTAKFRLSRSAHWGHNVGLVKLVTDVPAQREVWVKVSADVSGSVVASPEAVDLGALYQDVHGSPYRVQIESRDGKPFRIGAVKIDGNKQVGVEQADCLPEGKALCRALLVSVDERQDPGLIRSSIDVELPDNRKTLTIPVSGILFRAGTVVHNLNKEAHDNGEASTAGSVPITDALKKATGSETRGELQAPVPDGSGPLLKWQVKQDALIYGYFVCRSDSENGPLLRISNVVRTLSDDGQQATYRWRDTSAVSGRKYYYAVFSLYRDGHVQQLTGAMPKVAGPAT